MKADIHIPLFNHTSDKELVRKNNGTVLIVDDVPANIGVLFEFLKGYGLKILIAGDGESGIKKAKNAQPDLILLDVMMPGIDGFETCKQLKANAETKDIPIIFMTALSDTPFAVKGFQLGAVDYINKPIQQEEVLARINVQLTIRAYTSKLKTNNEQLLEINNKLQTEIAQRKKAEDELAKANIILKKLASLDGLTGISNRRTFDQKLLDEWQRASRNNVSLALILCDIDHFKLYNDTFGHPAGDECLRQVANAIHHSAQRSNDLVARYGGEEFAVLLSNVSPQDMMNIAISIQENIKILQIPAPQSANQTKISKFVTISMGLCLAYPNQDEAADFLLANSDLALYEAKSSGRNCIRQKECKFL
ncbi:MAG: diguanylate cyclase [Pseudomonadota bacterium]